MESFNILLLTVAVTVQVTSHDSTGEPPVQISKPKVTLNPSHAVLYSTETVTLHCEVPEAPSGLQYDWYKNSADLSEHQPSITARGSGKYECKAKKGTSESEISASYTLTLQDPPKAKLTVDPKWTEFFPSENIELKCEIEGGSSGWTFEWIKDTWTSEGDSVRAITVKHPDSGKYSCRGKLKNRQVTTQQSNAFQLNVKDLPEPKIQSDWTEAFPGEKVYLECVIQGVSENWNYMWFKDSRRIVSSDETNIKGNTLTLSVKSSHHGAYECQAELQGRTVSTARSKQHLLTVHELPQLKLSIESQWNMFYPTEKVTLKCSVDEESNKWGYEWFKNRGLLKKDKDISFTGNTLSISSAKAGHSGQYTCRGKHLTRTMVTTRETEAVQLRIQDIKPKPTITKHVWFELFYTEDRVQLHCNMPGVGWEYHWYKGSTLRITHPELTIDAVSLSDRGNYHCKAKRGDFSVDSETLQVRVQKPPQPHIQSDWTEAFPGEKVSLQCVIRDVSENWNYTWFKDSSKIDSRAETNIQGNNLTLSVKSSHHGAYECQAELQERNVSTVRSKQHFLTVHGSQPTILLQQDPSHPEIYTGEQVKLTCSIQEKTSKWQYFWQIDSQQVSTVNNPIYTIQNATLSQKGNYTCQVRRGEMTYANSTILTIREPPKANMSIESQWNMFYPTEKVTLKCSVDEESNKWGYEWFKNGGSLKDDKDISVSRNTLSISSAKVGHSGQYTCRGKHLARTLVTTRETEAVQLRIQDIKPKPNITKHVWFELFYAEEKVQLHCNMTGVGWEYHWYKGSTLRITHPELTIDAVSLSDSGNYHCKAQRGNFSVDSETLQVRVQKPPEPRIQSDWTEAFPGEKVSLQCVIQDVSENWNYTWFKDSSKIISRAETNIKGNNLTLSVKSSHHGAYECQAELQGRNVSTLRSKQHLLTVHEPPKPNLSIESRWNMFYPTEKVTLKCSVDEESNKWGYEWFKNGGSLKKVEDISFSGNTLSISSAKAGHSGQYTCRGKHMTRTLVTTRETEAVQLRIKDITPKPIIKKHEWFELFYTEERVKFDCNMSGVGWEYHWHKAAKPLIKNSEFTIDTVSLTDTGDYHCKAQRGDFSVDSETLPVRVQARPPAFLSLKTELIDIMTGDVTLRCNISDGRQWNYTWFMNGQQLNGSSDVLKVTGNEETIKSEFKCKGINTERPLYSALSDGFVANNIIFKRKILLAIAGCLVCCIFILIIGCIILKITHKPEVKETPEDLFFSMTDSKNQIISPMKEYMDNRQTELEESQGKAELISDCASAVHQDSVIKESQEKAELISDCASAVHEDSVIKESQGKAELISDCASAVHEDSVIKEEDTSATVANGLTSFKGL
ncbi:titin-like [Carassius auratus]|uniref:Titin-like n=1 Tax=Carassius auratus TaxID=7957 RepID=A0A6P6MSB2_CARAU|nr:titin-like [Carassius auratus]